MDCLRIEAQEGVLILEAQDEISADCSARTKEIVDKHFEISDMTTVILDLSELTSINSCGIGLMVTLHTKCVGQNIRLYVLSPNKNVLKTLDLVQLSGFFNIVESMDCVPKE